MDWEKNRSKVKGGAGGGKKGWGGASQGDGAGLRAALLSGPPGVGKTTTAVLACEVGHMTSHMTSHDGEFLSVQWNPSLWTRITYTLH